MSYIGTEPKDIRSFGRTKFDYTATQGQTAFTGADDDGKVLAFTVGQIEVYVNGILMDDSDFTTTGTGTVTLASAANLNDVINIVSFESNIPDNDYVPASGGTFTGNVTHSGTVTNSSTVTNSGAVTNSSTVTNSGAVTNSSTTTMTGDLTVDTNTFHVDVADNRVGIGTSTPDMGKLQINEDAAASTAIFIRNRHNVAGTHSDITFGYGEASNSYGAGIRFRQVDTTHGGQLEFYTDNASGTYTKQMQITENGHVTKPNTPHFFARGYSANVSGTDRATFSSIVRNNGSHFNNSTGNFTCPVAGTYHVTAFSGYKASDGYLGMGVGYNGSVLQYGWSSTNSNHAHATQCCTVIFDASANDTFYYYVNPSASYVKPHSSTGYSGMSVYLLG